MKQKPLFKVNMLQNKESTVYFVLPDIDKINIQILNLCVQFAEKYKQIILLCSNYEVDFYKFLIEKSKTFSDYKSKIIVEESTIAKLKEIQLKDCIIIYLHHNALVIEDSKRAILCMPSEDADLVFNDTDYKDALLVINYLKNIAEFLDIKDNNSKKSIDISTNELTEASKITRNFTNKKYNVVIVSDMFSTAKATNMLKKNKLKKHLILISKSPIGITDPKLLTLYDYTFIDLLAFMIQADSIACSKNNLNKNIVNNLKINILVSAMFKEYGIALEETMGEPK